MPSTYDDDRESVLKFEVGEVAEDEVILLARYRQRKQQKAALPSKLSPPRRCFCSVWIGLLILVACFLYFTSVEEGHITIESISFKVPTFKGDILADKKPSEPIADDVKTEQTNSIQSQEDVGTSSTSSGDEAESSDNAAAGVDKKTDELTKSTPAESEKEEENKNNPEPINADADAAGKPDEITSTLVESENANENNPEPINADANAGGAYTLDRMQKQFTEAKNELEEKLREDYGEYFEKMFMRKQDDGKLVSVGRFLMASPTTSDDNEGPSRDRMKDRLMMKLLQVLISSNNNNNNKKKRRLGGGGGDSSTSAEEASPVSFVWANGGHSSSAGHGNLYSESYTAVLERSAKGVFRSVGIDFEGRNYAMGGTSSYPELALCVDEIYGIDIDMLSWDFGMTDGGAYYAMLWYFYHAAKNPNRPATLAYQITTAEVKHKGRLKALKDLQDRGLTTLYEDRNVTLGIAAEVPDTSGMSEDEIKKLPAFVRNFKCDGSLERGEPFCAKEKFTTEFCPKRKFQTAWHEGWKWHALMGNVLALSMIEFMDDALKELVAINPSDPSSLLAEMKSKQDALYEEFFAAELPPEANRTIKDMRLPDDSFDLRSLFLGPSFCHIAQLPSEIRYRGILTETTTLIGSRNYDRGVSMQELMDKPSESEFMSLSFDADDRQKCEVDANMDYKDFFLVLGTEGEKKVVIPNDAELSAYHYKNQPLEGRILACLSVCPWEKCRGGEKNLREPAILDGLVKIKVNGVDVTSIDSMPHHCMLFRHDNQVKFEPNKDGKFEIRVHVKKDDSFIQFTSFIVM